MLMTFLTFTIAFFTFVDFKAGLIAIQVIKIVKYSEEKLPYDFEYNKLTNNGNFHCRNFASYIVISRFSFGYFFQFPSLNGVNYTILLSFNSGTVTEFFLHILTGIDIQRNNL